MMISIRQMVMILLVVSCCALLASCDKKPTFQMAPRAVDRIVLTNGGMIQGKIVEETDTQVRIQWQGAVVGFSRDEIESIERDVESGKGTEADGDIHVPTFHAAPGEEGWPKGADHLVFLTNGETIGGRISHFKDGLLTVRQSFEGGGAIEHDFDVGRVEKFQLWKPPVGRDAPHLAEFRTTYPDMELIKKGYYYVLTSERDPAELKRFLRLLDQFYYDFLAHFYELIDIDSEPWPLDVMSFGTRQEFDQVLTQIGYNARSNPIGFYHFHNRKLVIYNVKTDASVQLGLAQSQAYQKQMDQLAQQGGYNPAEIQLAKSDAQRQELRLMGDVLARNIGVIRHEGGHQLFHAFGLTPIEIYAGGWLIEGLAVYCESDPIGGINEEKLMLLRYEKENGSVMPLEYLLNFARGTGFHAMDPLYANVAYAESWAFIYFMMRYGYREQFFNFIREMTHQNDLYDAQAERSLLEKNLGKTLKEIEVEYRVVVNRLIRNHINEKNYQDYSFQLMRQN
jgi:hypothetical protein